MQNNYNQKKRKVTFYLLPSLQKKIINQDNKNIYWFGSNDELIYRSDGHTIKQYTKNCKTKDSGDAFKNFQPEVQIFCSIKINLKKINPILTNYHCF